MGALAPIITTALLTQGTQLVLNEVVGNSSRDANDQALEQLKQRQALDERQRAQDAELQRQSIALDAQEAEESRREALRRAVSRQRANFGAQGVGSGSGSSQAVLLGLFEESDDEKRRREELDNLLFGLTRPVVQTSVCDVTITAPNIGVQLDGYTDTNKPCYWNNFDRVLVEQPAVHGFHLFRSGAGDTPNANKFHACRAYSLGAPMSGAGFYIEEGRFNNALIDCEANVDGTAQGCFIIGAGCDKTLLINPYAESFNQVPNIKLEAGSIETSIINLLSVSDGAAIFDLSGGEYTAYNAGFPHKNRLQRTTCTDLNATLQRYDTEFIDTNGEITLDTSHSVHLVSSFGGALTVNVPNAGDAVGVMMVVKKTDSSANVITVREENGAGPDGKDFFLGAENDYVMMLSNGAEWFVIASNRSAGNTRFFDGSGTYDIDMAVDVYLLSSFGGAMTARLPPANAAESIGRTITIKKTDGSANPITVTEQGGSGPDNFAQPLNSQYQAITIVSDGGQWFILNKF